LSSDCFDLSSTFYPPNRDPPVAPLPIKRPVVAGFVLIVTPLLLPNKPCEFSAGPPSYCLEDEGFPKRVPPSAIFFAAAEFPKSDFGGSLASSSACLGTLLDFDLISLSLASSFYLSTSLSRVFGLFAPPNKLCF
jgi:hypothetical protein